MGSIKRPRNYEGLVVLLSRMIFPAVLLLAAPLVSATPLDLASDLASEELQPSNKSSAYWACPEYSLAFHGNDITQYQNIHSWQECGRLCHVHKTCSHWTWDHARSDHPNKCWLKSGDGGAANDGYNISGQESCYTC